jgi:hypothetical protein
MSRKAMLAIIIILVGVVLFFYLLGEWELLHPPPS